MKINIDDGFLDYEIIGNGSSAINSWLSSVTHDLVPKNEWAIGCRVIDLDKFTWSRRFFPIQRTIFNGFAFQMTLLDF